MGCGEKNYFKDLRHSLARGKVCNILLCCWFSVGFPLVFRWFYYLKIVGLILPINFVNILLVDQNNNFWLL